MTDFFIILQETRRPWLDPGSLKQKFLALSARVHPDKVTSTDEAEKNAASKNFALLNAAYHCLNRPKSRLLHLIELETGSKPADVQSIPNALAGLFGEVAAACRDADRFLAEKNSTVSPLLQVQMFERSQEWTEKLNALQIKLGSLGDELLAVLQAVDSDWFAADAGTRKTLMEKLEELYRLFGYFDRWHAQVQERIARLML